VNDQAASADSGPGASSRVCRIAVVGPCASGKSTLVSALRERGYDAYAPAQEHSAVPELWRHANPDFVIALAVNFSAVLRRRGSQWPKWLYELQMRRLASAYASSDITIDTSPLTAGEVAANASTRLAERGIWPSPACRL
jgi:GTPase SAR1 family protein